MNKPYRRTTQDDPAEGKFAPDVLRCIRNRNTMYDDFMRGAIAFADGKEVPADLESGYRNEFAPRLIDAEILLWRPDLFDAACEGEEAFLGTNPIDPTAISPQAQFWVLETERGRSRKWDDMASRISSSQINLAYGVDRKSVSLGRLIAVYIVPTTRTFQITWMLMPFDREDYRRRGHRYTGVGRAYDWLTVVKTVPPEIIAVTNRIFAAYAFTRQSFTGRQGIYLPRLPDRYRHQKFHVSMVNKLVLRRTASNVTQDDKALAVADRFDVNRYDGEHCWVQRGHWRRLPAPRKADGAKVTYVRPCVKGNTDGTMLPPRDNLYHVKR